MGNDKSMYTPGPWKTIAWGGLLEIRQESNLVCGIARVGYEKDGALPNPQTIANASLIAAAPELLEALQSLNTSYLDGLNDGASCACSRCKDVSKLADTAINKAINGGL